jgi:acid phosphatase family membrane protein YuiD
MFMDFFTEYKFLIVPAIAWFIAQFLKFVITLITEKKLDLSQMVSMGGMPSSHSSTVTALATTIGVNEGWASPIFAFCAIFALIVMYDAGGVRRTVGTQSVVLNKILDELLKGNEQFEERLKEFIGHSRFEIIIGAFLGIGIGWWLA